VRIRRQAIPDRVHHLAPAVIGPSPPPILIDSGGTGHYFAPSTNLLNVQPTTTPIQVQIANQQHMQSTHTAELPLPGIPQAARQVHIFPNMATSLLAPGPLVQQGCTLQMDSHQCTIQCPNCQPIHCPINNPGLYLVPATAYNAIDVDEYIEVANQAHHIAATEELSEHIDNTADIEFQARYIAATKELSEHLDEPHHAAIVERSEPPTSRWASPNPFSALAEEDHTEIDNTVSQAQRSQPIEPQDASIINTTAPTPRRNNLPRLSIARQQPQRPR
jgi:hypothetical protein